MTVWPDIFRKLKNVLRRHGRTDQDAEDLIQDAFIRFEAYRRHTEVEQPEAFLTRAVVNLSIDRHRHERTLPETEVLTDDTIAFDTGGQPDEVLAGRQRLKKLSEGLDALPQRTREAFAMHRIDGLSQGEVARRLGITVSAVEKHIAKALMFLQEWMDRDA